MPNPVTAYLYDLQTAVVAAINGAPSGAWGLPFTAAPTFVPIVSIADGDVNTLQVLAAPSMAADEMEGKGPNGKQLDTRGGVELDVWIDVGVLQKLESLTDPAIPTLMALTDQIQIYLINKPQSNYLMLGTTNNPPYSYPHLVESLTFVSIVTLHYQVAIDI